MSRRKWPDEALLFKCVDDLDVFNDLWAGKFVEMSDFDAAVDSIGLSVRIRRVEEGDLFGYMNNVDGLIPLTPAARDMLAIARAGETS